KLYARNRDRLKDSLGLSKNASYKEHYALKNVDMEVKTGESVGIIGVNGSGKSTILKIITGVLNATSGDVQINGRISALLELGAGFNMEYTGLENVYLNGTMMGFTEKEIDERLQDILDFADIGDFVHQPVKTYSSGMFVRLAFAVAINIDPEILIVDEALSVGDVFFQAKCYHKFEEFKKMGKTILFVSHDLTSIAKYCDRVILLNKGVKLAEDISSRLDTIESLTAKVEERSPKTVAEYRQKLLGRMQEVLQSTTIDESRILMEAAIYADKVAVDEETVRLRSHLSQLRGMLKSNDPMGRKMDFLIQEVNRESNTVGSKCNDVEIATVVVNLKAEVEKIREQVQNIE
ncbi:MAG: DUF1732 domain-containing protein, partial [Oscillospiraceae bacterium]|nr:DUF1732 domain-containing protein [Oscillospiraceae bacterium]